MEKDEEKLMNRKRLEKWIKIFLLFLAFVWLCTIISKSIYVSGLPIVKTETPSKKYVEHIVETDGIVTTGGEIAVNTQAGLRVDRLYVMQGDEVKAGDVLFTIDTEDIADIISEKETALSKLQCNLADLQVNAVIDAQKKEVAILWAQEDYETADKETSIAKERAKEAIDKAESELAAHLADTVPYTSDSARRNAWDDYHDWVNSGYNISDRITAKEREIQDLQEQLAQLGQSNGNRGTEGSENGQTTGNTLSGAAGNQETGGNADRKDGVENGDQYEADMADENNCSNDKEDGSAGLRADEGTEAMDHAGKDGSLEMGNSANNSDFGLDNNTNDGSGADVDSGNDIDSDTDAAGKTDTDYQTGTDNNGNSNDSTDDNEDVDQGGDTDHKGNTDNGGNVDNDGNKDSNAGTDDNTGTLPDDDKENQNPTDENNAERTELQNKIRKANEELLALQDEMTRHDRNVVEQPDYSAEELKFDEWQNTRLALEANVQKAKENYNDVSYNREVTLRQKMRDIANVQVTTRADSTAAIYELDMRQIQAEIAGLSSLQKQKGEIKAESDGIISKIQVEVGGRTADTAAVLMTDTQRPCQFKFSITKEQGKYVHLNDTVNLKLNGQSDMEVTVDYFTENMQGGYDLICMLPEGVGKPGLSGSIQKSVQGEYHELTLPVDAVFEESNGYFIYTLNEKEGILGSEYYAEKIKVQIRDKNDRFAALEPGTISADTKVITYTTKELKQGESVRPH